MNPLLDYSDLPRFDAIQPEHIAPAVTALLAQCSETISQLENQTEPTTWNNFIKPLDDVTERLNRAWGIVSHLNAVVDTPELRAAYNKHIPNITKFWTALSQNLVLFKRYKALKESAEYTSFSPARKKIIDNALRDFQLGGAELEEQKKQRFAQIQERQAILSTQFSEHVLDATNDYFLLVDTIEILSGLPQDILETAQKTAHDHGQNGFRFTLHFPSYFPILQYANDRTLRETIYRASVTKASEQGTCFSQYAQWDNTPIMNELLKLRQEEAQLLSYRNYAEVSLVPKMADSPEQVIHFLEHLAERARPVAEQDLVELCVFAQKSLNLKSLEAWDIPYASEKLREQQYAFSEQEVKKYFQEPHVLSGLFEVAQTLFGIQIKADSAPVWHPSVQFFRIEKEGQLIAQFYCDLYARPGKQGGAWMDDARSRRLIHPNPQHSSHIQTPIAYLTCNFSKPTAGQPALFTHDEVITLFHEFGHGLHHMLTEVDELGVSGISGVEWDAVELPSQFMENFCWEWEVLQKITHHIDSSLPLPHDLFQKMLAAKNFQSGLHMMRQIEMSLLDMHLHFDHEPSGTHTIQNLIDDIRSRFAVIIPPPFNRFQNAFGHIFAGGYAAGYYSYKWAEILSADIYSAFEEECHLAGTTLSSKMGQKFKQEILATGGSRPALESFKAFRGREPTSDALLRHHGILH